MHICISFYGFKMVMFIKLKKRLICFFYFIFTVVLKRLAILPLRVYFILNKINNHAVLIILICHTCEVDGLSQQRRSAH